MKDRIRKAYEEYQQRGLSKFPSCTLYLSNYQEIMDMLKEQAAVPEEWFYRSISIAFEAGVVLGQRWGKKEERKRQNEAKKGLAREKPDPKEAKNERAGLVDEIIQLLRKADFRMLVIIYNILLPRKTNAPEESQALGILPGGKEIHHADRIYSGGTEKEG